MAGAIRERRPQGGPWERRQASGFTLMEILVALAIVSLVFTSLFAVFDKVLDVADQVEQRKSLSQTGRLVLMRLSSDLESLLRPEKKAQEQKNTQNATGKGSWRAFQASSLPESGLGSSENATVLSFATSSGLEFNSTWPSHSLYQVEYIVEPLQEGDRYRLLRRQRTFPYLEATGRQSLELCRKLTGFQLRLLTEEDTLPQSSWSTGLDEEQQQQIPSAVGIRFSLQGESGSETFSLFKTLKE